MRTIGRHWPKSAPRGDHPVRCDLCGTVWRLSQLHRERSGLLVCPWDVGPERADYIRAPHIMNNEGTGTGVPQFGEHDSDVPVVL